MRPAGNFQTHSGGRGALGQDMSQLQGPAQPWQPRALPAVCPAGHLRDEGPRRQKQVAAETSSERGRGRLPKEEQGCLTWH
jgi:hypothetical protein